MSNDDNKIRSIGPADANGGIVLPDAQTEVKVDEQEMQDLGEFLQSLRTVVLGQEQRLSYIEEFLAVVFGGEGEDNEVEGEGLQEGDDAPAEDLPGADDSPSSPEDAAHGGGDDIPQQDT